MKLSKENRIKDREQKKCDAFNVKFPVGTKMHLKDDFGKLHEVEVSGSASVVSMQAAVWATGFGCYLLERFIPIPHPRLSKAQQKVVDNMREGWELHPPFLLKKEDQKHWIRYGTYCALLKKGVVEKANSTNNIYQLTEKYRKNETKQSTAGSSR